MPKREPNDNERTLADDNEHHGLPEDAPHAINPYEEDDFPASEEKE